MGIKYRLYRGLQVNSWFILGDTAKFGKNIKWEVQCKCGARQWKLPRDIYINSACFHCTHSTGRKGAKNNNYTGSTHVPGIVLTNIRAGAKKRNISVKIIIQDLEDQWLLQDGKCAYTGLQLTFSSVEGKGDASVDRINSSKGYIKDNIQFVHKRINIMKNDMDNDEFLLLCKLVTEDN